MSSRHDQQPTRVQPAVPQPPPAPAAHTPLDVKTLVITAAASALAAYICSKVWAPGTLASAAFTPVAVALFREALAKPTDVVTSALPAAIPLARRGGAATGAYGAPPVPPMDGDPTRVRPAGPLSDSDATQVHRAVRPGEEPTRVSPAAGAVEPVEVHAVARRSRRRWRIAIVTGLLGFVIAALLITVPEVIAGKDNTTIFQGGRSTPTKTEKAPATTTTTTTDEETDTTQTETVTTTTEAEPTTTTTQTETVTTEAAPTTTATTPTETTPSATTPEEATPRAAPEGSTDSGAVDP